MKWISVCWVSSCLSACQSYEAQPLEPEGFLALVEASRVEALPVSMDGVLTFERAADLLRLQGPEIRAVEAAYRTALARADIPTPLANPTLEVGARFGFGSEMDEASVNRVAPFGSIGITIPTANKLSLQDEINRLRAESLRICAVARHRETEGTKNQTGFGYSHKLSFEGPILPIRDRA